MKDVISSTTIKGNVPAIRYYTMEKVNEVQIKKGVRGCPEK